VRPAPAFAAAVVAVVTLTTACGGSGKKTTSTATATSTAAESSTSASSPGTTAKPATGSATTPVSIAVTHPTAHLVAVRAARQQTVDRVVFEFTEQVPGYKVSYEKKPIMNTAGKAVSLPGSAALVVRMEQASGFNQDTAKPTYTGPTQVQPAGTRAVTEVAQVEDFEAVLSWAVGVNAEIPFRVSTLTSPPRLVIDLAS
jgi:hypothetical protein